MATSKKRITVTVSDRVASTIQDFSSLQRVSQSAVIASLLEVVQPSLDRTVRLLRAAMASEGHIRFGLVQSLESLEQDIGNQVTGLETGLEDLLEELNFQAHEPSQPPSSNTGVRSKPSTKGEK